MILFTLYDFQLYSSVGGTVRIKKRFVICKAHLYSKTDTISAGGALNPAAIISCYLSNSDDIERSRPDISRVNEHHQ